jgi:hypothetical protein
MHPVRHWNPFDSAFPSFDLWSRIQIIINWSPTGCCVRIYSGSNVIHGPEHSAAITRVNGVACPFQNVPGGHQRLIAPPSWIIIADVSRPKAIIGPRRDR